jgi:hypothetical protein
MKIDGQRNIIVENGDAGCRAAFLTPDDLKITQTDQFDPPPRPRIKLRQWHLQAGTSDEQKRCEFVTVIRPFRKGTAIPSEEHIERLSAGYACRIALTDGEAIVLLRATEAESLGGYEAETDGDVAAVRLDTSGKVANSFVTGGTSITYRGEVLHNE